MEWMGRNIHFWFLHRKSSTSKCHYKTYPCSLCPGEWRIGETWAFFSALPPSGRVRSRSWSWQTFSGQEPCLQASQIPQIPQPFWAACPAPLPSASLNWPRPSPPPMSKGPGVPVDLKQGPSLQSRCFDSCPGQWGQVTHNRNNPCVFRMWRRWGYYKGFSSYCSK